MLVPGTFETLAATLGRAHRQINRAVRRLERLIRTERPGTDPGEAQERVRRMLLDHFLLEEETLFPYLLLVTGNQARAAVDILAGEHDEMRRALTAVGSDLMAGTRPSPAFDLFRQTLALHQERETRLFYPLSDQLIPDAVRKHIARKAG